MNPQNSTASTTYFQHALTFAIVSAVELSSANHVKTDENEHVASAQASVPRSTQAIATCTAAGSAATRPVRPPAKQARIPVGPVASFAPPHPCLPDIRAPPPVDAAEPSTSTSNAIDRSRDADRSSEKLPRTGPNSAHHCDAHCNGPIALSSIEPFVKRMKRTRTDETSRVRPFGLCVERPL